MSKNGIEDKQKISRAENHKKQKPSGISTEKLKGTRKKKIEIDLKTYLKNLKRR